jgi:hypothetical protein
MALPNPDRTIPNTDTVGPPGPSGGDFANKVAAEVQRIWDLVPNMLVNIGGSADAITAECDPPLVSSYIHGQRFWLIPSANNTGSVTINIDSRGQVDVVSYDGQQLQAGDLVAGEGTELVYDGVNNQMRLVHPTARELLARASGGASWWEQIGDSGLISAPVASVEFTFTPGRYSFIKLMFQDVAASSFTSSLHATLRHSGGDIVNLQLSLASTSTAPQTGWAVFAVGGPNAQPVHFGEARGAQGANVRDPVTSAGRSATPPDRVRVSYSSVNLASGRVLAYGLRIEQD